MAGVDGIAPPLTGSEPAGPLLSETPKNSSAILSPRAGTVKSLQWLRIKFTTCLLKSDTEQSVVASVGYPLESLET